MSASAPVEIPGYYYGELPVYFLFHFRNYTTVFLGFLSTNFLRYRFGEEEIF